jgi:hypothetical protein
LNLRHEISPCPPAGEGCHLWVMQAAWACRKAGHTANEALRYIEEAATRPPTPSNEFVQAVEKVFSATLPPRGVSSRPPSPGFNPAKLAAIARRMDGFGAGELAAISPMRPDTRTPASFLHAIFAPGEKVLCFSKYRSQGQAIWQRPELLARFDATALDALVEPAEGQGAWFLSNPITGDFVELERLKSEHNPSGRTRRAEESITAFRHLLLESDKAESAIWLAALVQMPLPILSICESGGRSLHALVRIDAKDGREFREIIAASRAGLEILGADPAALSPVRLTRLPQCWRADKGRWQRLLYLNPNPTRTPICEMQPCEPAGAAQARYRDMQPAFDLDTFTP